MKIETKMKVMMIVYMKLAMTMLFSWTTQTTRRPRTQTPTHILMATKILTQAPSRDPSCQGSRRRQDQDRDESDMDVMLSDSDSDSDEH
jgi:hypothetical protein